MSILAELEGFAFRVGGVLRTPSGIARLLVGLGYSRDESVTAGLTEPLAAFVRQLDELGAMVDSAEWQTGESTVQKLERVREALAPMYGGLEVLRGALSSIEIPPDVAEEAVQFLLVGHLTARHPTLVSHLELIGAISRADVGLDGPESRDVPYQRVRLDWNRLIEILAQPSTILEHGYQWGDEEFDYRLLLSRLGSVFESHGLRVRTDEYAEALLGSHFPSAVGLREKPWALSIPLYAEALDGGGVELGLSVLPVESTATDDTGLGIIPYTIGSLEQVVQLSETARLEVEGASALTGGVLVALHPHTGVKLDSGLLGGDVSSSSRAFKATLILERPGAPLRIVGGGGGPELSVARIDVAAGVDLRDDDADAFAELRIIGGTFGLSLSDGDEFTRAVRPRRPSPVTFDLTAGVSRKKGFYLGGAAGLELTIPIHLSVGGVQFCHLHLLVKGESTTPPQIDVGIGLSLAAMLGPVNVAIERIGVLESITFPSSGHGNVGPANVAFAFLPPTGAGLAIDASGIKGGGFIDHNADLGRYTGILDLALGDIALVAVAIVTTTLPGGRKGYALIVNIGITFSPPLTLPYNFNLQGCGGLLALNRTTNVERLRSGLKAKTLDSILFPEDPILNASKIISDSEAVFPVEEGRFIVGPMVKLGWGPAGLVTADIAIIIELPSPITVVLLGQVKARLPKGDDAKIKINIDVLGTLSFAKKELAIDAEIFDSSIVGKQLSGSTALRLRWGAKPVFAMSLGGFHPKFDPPPQFPALKRLTVDLISSNKLSLDCKVLLALTSNTLQFGARLQLHAEACGAELDGKLSFDTLITFSPFAFEIDMGGSISASYRGHDIASLHVSVDLSGPNPWHAKGKAKISVACFDCTAKFNKTWGNDSKARLPTVDPLQPFLDELDLVANWGSGALARRAVVESLKGLEPGPTTPQPFILAHPAGALEVRQRLLPLDLTLERFANAEVKDHFKFDIALALGPEDSASPGEPSAEVSDLGLHEERVEEKFAVGQFRDWSKSTRLSQPSFESKKAGVRVGPQKARIDGTPVPCDLEYESTVIKKDGLKARAVRLPSWLALRRTLGSGALQRAGVQLQGMGKFKVGGPPRITVREEGYSVVDSATLAPLAGIKPTSGRPLGMTDAQDLARTQSAGVLVVPEYEEEPV
jgi:hypothetical protein